LSEHIVAGPRERAALARRLDLQGLERLEAEIEIRPGRSRDLIVMTGRLGAEVTQTCVVTLEPVSSRLDQPIDLLFSLGPPPGGEEIFLDPAEPARPEILALGTVLLVYCALFQTADGGQALALGLLRGVQDTRVPMIMASVSYWLFGVPVMYVAGFVLGWGAEGVWLGLVIGLAAAGVSLMWRFWARVLPRLRAEETGAAEAAPA